MKRESFLRPLTRGHLNGLLAAKRIQERLALDPMEAELPEEVRRFHETDLEPHFSAEEALIEYLEGLWGPEDPDLARTRREHALLRADQREGTPGALERFAQLLRNHIRYEEDTLFPRVEGALSGEDRERWGRRFIELDGREARLPRPPRRA